MWYAGRVDTPGEPIRCNVDVGCLCEEPASNLLIIRTENPRRYEVHPRCKQHPARSYVTLIRHMNPACYCVIVPLDHAIVV